MCEVTVPDISVTGHFGPWVRLVCTSTMPWGAATRCSQMTLGRTCSHFIHVEVEYHSKDDCAFPTECMFVCLRAYLKNHMAKLRFQCISTVTMVQSSSKYSSWVACIRAKSAIYNCLVTIVPFCPFLCPPVCQNSGAAHAQCRGIIVIESFCIRVAVFLSILEHVQCGEWRWGRPLLWFRLFVPKLVATATSFEHSEKRLHLHM